jgi:photosystem II stability/assembly factor-like uncharacterized protein
MTITLRRAPSSRRVSAPALSAGSRPSGAGCWARPWNDISYVTGTEAWVVYSPADFAPGLGELMVTRDGGRTWQRVTP